ncbi:MAG TPA: MBL fold metallo-hydrolase [Tepidisphaeraceae bacterium]
MRIQFCGADRTVTGSCHLIETNGVRVFLDMGMFQGPREEATEFNHWLPDGAASVDAVVLSHGHLDHCGKLPVLVRAGYRGPIYCTPATAEVSRVVLEDAAQIQEEDAAYLNQRTREPGEQPVQPLYTRSNALDVLKQFRRVAYGQKVDVRTPGGTGLSFTLFDAGHILGSGYVWIEYTENGQPPRTLLFTADVGRYDTPILRDPQAIPGAADCVISESTYGNRKHGPMSEVEPQLLAAVQSCIERRGRLIVPSFAVGRTQTVLFYMQNFIAQKKIPPIPIYVDSPMGVEISHIHSQFRENYDAQTNAAIGTKDLFGLSNVTFASSSQQSKQINNDRGPCVIIASSPTCEFGRVLHHLKQSVEEPNDLVLFVGWIPPQTLGRRLQDGQKRARIFDRWYDVKCRIETIHGLSAHADGDEIARFLAPTLVGKTNAYIVHGEPDQAEGLAKKLLAAGIGSVVIPARDTTVLDV